MKRLIMALTIAALGLTFSGTAQAFTQTATGNMIIGATVIAGCTVTTAPMDFGTLSHTFVISTTSTITVNCSNGTAYRVDLDGGQNMYGVQNYPRQIKTGTATAGSTNTATYKLYNSSTMTLANEWGDNGATFCPTACSPVPSGLAGTGSGADQVLTVYGSAWPTTNPVGSYTDTLTVTVNY